MHLGSWAPTARVRLTPDQLLWLGCLSGPIAWFVQLELTYAFAQGYCGSSGRLGLHLLSLGCLLAAAGGGYLAWRGWGVAGGGHDWPSATEGGPADRARFLGALGLMSCSLCAVVILAQWIAVVALDPCSPVAPR